MSAIKKLFLKAISVPNFKDEEDSRRRKQVNLVLLVSIVAAIFVFIGTLMTDLVSSEALDKQPSSIYSLSILFVVGLIILYAINRYLSGAWAAILLVLLFALVIPIADEPEQVAYGRSLIFFTLPIILAGMVLQPLYSYLAAGLSSIIVMIISIGILHSAPSIPGLVVFFMLAWISHVTSGGLKKALKKTSISNQKLRESEAQYRGVFDGVNDAIIVETLSGEILDANESACKMYGWRYEELLEKTVKDLVPPEFHILLPHENDGDVLPEETLETVNVRANGEHFPVAVRGRIQKIGDEKRLLVVVRDITNQKREEQELIQAKNAAEVAAQVKADFLANMSHELRTPLNAIYGMTSLMLDTQLEAEQQDFMETIRRGSESLLSVINQILDFSKIEAGKLELEKQPFYIRSCIEDALDMLAGKASEKMIDLAYIIEDKTPPVVIGDVTRLRQVLVNLLGNAVKFTESGEVVVRAKGFIAENEQQVIQISVRDTGIGIPNDKLVKLFQSFSQVDTSTTRKYGGTGLGLAISKEIVEKMGGKIWVESEAGKGSTFHFTIFVDADANSMPITPDKVQPHLAGKRILIVEASATNRLILLNQTAVWGMKPRAVESESEALLLLKEGQIFDIAILDTQMSDTDGFALVEKIHDMDTGNTHPMIILISAKRETTSPENTKIAAFLSKPIKTSNLLTVLTNVVTAASTNKKKQRTGTGIDPTMANRHPLRILLAEDNMVNQKVATKLLSKLGYRVDVAGNGVEVIEALERQTYDVILMDIQMPEMDGDEATRQVRAKWPEDRQPHIVAMTAHALEGDREKYLARGMDDYVSKPISVNALVTALEKAKYID